MLCAVGGLTLATVVAAIGMTAAMPSIWAARSRLACLRTCFMDRESHRPRRRGMPTEQSQPLG